MTDTIPTTIEAGVCLLSEQVDELAELLTQAATLLREQDGDLATELLLWADTVQGDGDFDADMLTEYSRLSANPEGPVVCSHCGKHLEGAGEQFYAAPALDTDELVWVHLCSACYDALGQPTHGSIKHVSDIAGFEDAVGDFFSETGNYPPGW